MYSIDAIAKTINHGKNGIERQKYTQDINNNRCRSFAFHKKYSLYGAENFCDVS